MTGPIQFAWPCVIALLSTFLQSAGAPSSKPANSALEASVLPVTPFIEVRGGQQIVNVDLMVQNHSTDAYHLVALRLAVLDRQGKLEIEREVNQNGKPPALDIVGELTVPPQGTTDLFQPFATFDSSVDLTTMRFTLLFNRAGQQSSAVPLTAAASLTVDVHPQHYQPAPYCLPLPGLVVVHDGHDLLSHHRRYDLAHRFQANPSNAVSANLYAYDFMRTTADGALYIGDYTRKEDWLSYGASIRAPADGVVAATANDVPENTFDSSGNAQVPPEAEAIDPDGFGNYVTLRHGDGRVSWLLHMQPGSVRVRPGDRVHAGQILGRVGFSGDSLFPHLHYNVTTSSNYPSQGVPSYFRSFTRVLGGRHVRVKHGEVDTGDLLLSADSCP